MKIIVTAKARAKENKIEKTGNSTYRVSIKEAPDKGRANAAIIALLAEYFDIPKSQIRLESGHSSKIKLFSL